MPFGTTKIALLLSSLCNKNLSRQLCIFQQRLAKLQRFNLKEHSLYLVKVKCSVNNIEHESVLFTGFSNNSYTMVYNNTYSSPIRIEQIHSMEVLKELGNIKP